MYTNCNGSPQQTQFQFANKKLPHSRCRAFWVKSGNIYELRLLDENIKQKSFKPDVPFDINKQRMLAHGPRYYLDTLALHIFGKSVPHDEFQKMVLISFKEL